MNASRRCTAATRSGQPCRAWAVQDSDPPRCAAHNRPVPDAPGSFYRLPTGDLAELVAMAGQVDLEDEIALVRVTLRRLFALVAQSGDSEPDGVKLAALVFTGSRTIAQLLRDQRALSGKAAEGLLGAVGVALDELATEVGIEL